MFHVASYRIIGEKGTCLKCGEIHIECHLVCNDTAKFLKDNLSALK